MALPTLIEEYLPTKWSQRIAASTIALAGIELNFPQLVPSSIVSTWSKTELLYLTILILFTLWVGTSTTLLLVIRENRRKIIQNEAKEHKRQQYRFDKHLGISVHKITGDPFCPSCLLSDIESPLKEDAKQWICQRKDCGQFYRNPDYTPPPQKPKHWMLQ